MTQRSPEQAARSHNPSGEAPDRSIGLRTATLALVCSALWGGTTVAIRYSVDDLPPIGTAGLRFALGFVFLLFWCRWEGSSLAILPDQRKPILVTALFLFVQISLLNLGTKYTTASHSTLFINVHPIFVALFAHFAFHSDTLTHRKLAGLATAMVGVCIVVLTSHGSGPAVAHPTLPAHSLAAEVPAADPPMDTPTLPGDLLVLASGVLLGAKTVYVKRVLGVIEPGKLLLWHELLAVVLFFATSFVFEGVGQYRFTAPAVLGVLYQGLMIAGFCFALWTTLLKHHRASHLAVFAFTTPLFGLTFAHLLRGDPISPSLIVGGLGVAAGIYLVTSNGSSPRNKSTIDLGAT